MRAARFEMSAELLGNLLHLPEGAQISGVRMGSTLESVEFIVDDPSLPPSSEPHDADPILTKEQVRWDWNIERYRP